MLTSQPVGVVVAAQLGELVLQGGGGEPVDLRRTIMAHGVATLPPNEVDEAIPFLETTLVTGTGTARTLRIAEARPGVATVSVLGGEVAAREAEHLLLTARRLLRLDEDLSPFYRLAASDPRLDWAVTGAGRMLRSPTVFEDVVKTICTTNCAWSATERMVGALVGQLGPIDARGRHAFPPPQTMAGASADFFRDVVRAGYRGAYLRALAQEVAEERLDLECLSDPELPDAEAEARLLALPGVGPYAAAHIMLTGLGRYSRLVLDSWTRPTYARLTGRTASDKAIARSFRGYRAHRGLAFWLYLTRSWCE